MAQNKQTDRDNQRRPEQDQGGERQKSSNDDDLDRNAKTDKSGMQDEDIEEGDETESEDEEQ